MQIKTVALGNAGGLADFYNRHATIGTEFDNYRAMCLYLNDGYRLLFTEYRFGKELRL